QKLLAVRDPQSNLAVITRVDVAKEVYQGAYANAGPDLLVGYNRRYRAGWKTILGAFTEHVLENNTNPWSGDHCMDYTVVPVVLLSNRRILMSEPALTDIAPTILAEFGIPKTKDMMGQSVFVPGRASALTQPVPAEGMHVRVVQVKIDDELLGKLKQCAEAGGYESVDEFVVRVLEKEVNKIIPPAAGDS